MLNPDLSSIISRSGFTIGTLAESSGVPAETIRNLIYRRSTNPTLHTVFLLSKALHIPMELFEKEAVSSEEEALLWNYKNSCTFGKDLILSLSFLEADLAEKCRHSK